LVPIRPSITRVRTVAAIHSAVATLVLISVIIVSWESTIIVALGIAGHDALNRSSEQSSLMLVKMNFLVDGVVTLRLLLVMHVASNFEQ
jgi:hypothetical protein